MAFESNFSYTSDYKKGKLVIPYIFVFLYDKHCKNDKLSRNTVVNIIEVEVTLSVNEKLH